MNPGQRLKEIEDRLLKLDAERVSLLREIQNLRNEIAVEIGINFHLKSCGMIFNVRHGFNFNTIN